MPPQDKPRAPVDRPSRTRVVILGAAGRDFHNFNQVYRDDPRYEVIAFTAAQIGGIGTALKAVRLRDPEKSIPVRYSISKGSADMAIDAGYRVKAAWRRCLVARSSRSADTGCGGNIAPVLRPFNTSS